MPYKVFLDKRVEKSFDKIDKKLITKILDSVSELKNFSQKSKNIKKLQTPFDGYRKRIGDYRILFKVSGTEIFVYSVKHRKDAYK